MATNRQGYYKEIRGKVKSLEEESLQIHSDTFDDDGGLKGYIDDLFERLRDYNDLYAKCQATSNEIRNMLDSQEFKTDVYTEYEGMIGIIENIKRDAVYNYRSVRDAFCFQFDDAQQASMREFIIETKI